MNGLTDGQIDAIQFPSIDYATAHVIRTHRRAFARKVIAADRELQDAKLTNAPTDSQINDALKVFACTVIGADRAIKDARHLEELNAYALTVSNLRTETAGRGVPDGWKLVPNEPTDMMIGAGLRHVDGMASMPSAYRAMLAAAPQPPAQPTCPSIDAAENMGGKGAPAVESERLAFEAWMRGHCWALCAEWSETKGYVGEFESKDYVCPRAMQTRGLWAAWRDRAALALQPPAQPDRPVNCGSGHCSCIECVVAQETCKWTQNDEWWSAACGASWAFIDCGPVENGVNFCHGCGKPVEIVGAK